jgi:Na+-driven multidrug efflux pump
MTLISAIGNPLIWAESFMIPSGLRAAGDAKFTSITALLSMWLVRVTLGYALGITFGFGINGIWFAMVFEWFVRGSIFIKRLMGARWHSHSVI